MKKRGYFSVAFATTLNVILYALTFGRFLWLEGRVRGGVFRNWGRRYRYRPGAFAEPTSEQEIVALVKGHKGVRVFGAGHSFNPGVVADNVLVSLDGYKGMIWRDLAQMRVAFKGGTRVREISRVLFDNGAAIGALPSHDAQSIAGIISTDVHGTGRDWGFVSEWVERIKLVDGRGEVHECGPEDELFKAAIGGIGAVGIITEVVLRAVPRFNIDQKVEMADLRHVRDNFDDIFARNKHTSLYVFPFSDRCQINTWNPTENPRSRLGPLREFINISKDALLTAWFGGLMANTGLLPRLATHAYRFKRGTDLVLESYKGYNRSIYPLHQELEFTVPFEQTFDVCERLLKLYQRMYAEARLPYTFIEVRFTPAGHERTLVGAGRGRRSAWIDVICNDEDGFEKYYAACEDVMRELDGARPHMGKYCQSIDKEFMRRAHGEHYVRFLRMAEKHDPEGKFLNDFTRRVLR
jgi:FAD/FMN-containing dehydrogenase